MADSVLRKKSYSFALKVIKVYKQIVADKKVVMLFFVMLLCRKTIQRHNAITFNESNETEYWICLLRDSEYISSETAKELFSDNQELLRMLVSSIKTAKQNANKPLTNS